MRKRRGEWEREREGVCAEEKGRVRDRKTVGVRQREKDSGRNKENKRLESGKNKIGK